MGKEFAIGPGGSVKAGIKVRSMEDIPSGRQALRDHRQREHDFYDISKMPGGNTRENVSILAQRLRKLEMTSAGAVPDNGKSEFR